MSFSPMLKLVIYLTNVQAKIQHVQLGQCLSSLDKKYDGHLGHTLRQTVGQKQARQSERKFKYEFFYKRDRTLKFQKSYYTQNRYKIDENSIGL